MDMLQEIFASYMRELGVDTLLSKANESSNKTEKTICYHMLCLFSCS